MWSENPQGKEAIAVLALIRIYKEQSGKETKQMVSSFIPKMPKFQAYQVPSKFTRIISFMKNAFKKKISNVMK
jgi:hypothetical protein